MKHISLKLLSILFLGLSVFVSCDKDDDEEDTTTNDNSAKVMVVHASPDAPSVDLYVDNSKVNSIALSYPNNTGYIKVTPGNRTVKVTLAGSTTSVLESSIPFTANTNTSIFAYNRLPSPSALVVQDNLTVPASGKAHVRFFHLSPDAPAVTIGTLSNTTFNAIPAFTNRSFETQATATVNQSFTPIDAGNYTLQVRLASNNTAVLTIPNVNLQSGKIYTIFARGLVSGSGNQALGAEIITHN